MKIFKYSVVFLCIAFAIGFLITASLIIKQSVVDMMINDSVKSMVHTVKYKKAAMIKGVPVIEQEISCGYACIEMVAMYLGRGSTNITEEKMYEENNQKITTSDNNGLLNEMKKQFPEYKVTKHKNLKNSELIEMIYDSLSNSVPVIFSFAAVDEKKVTQNPNETEKVWTMHYGVVVEMDLPGDRIKVNNPYGYSETYSVDDFLKAARFASYENMEFYLKLGFGAEIFTKNTIYIMEKPEKVKTNESPTQ